jgi:replicative DNA helicase
MIASVPPQSLDSEQATLGSILIDRDAIIEVADFLRPEDFYRQAHGRIYAVMLDMFEHRQQIDVVTVAEALERADELESVGGAGYLSTLGNDTPTAVHVAQYGRIVERKAVLRRLIGAAGKIAAIGYEDGADVQDALNRAMSEMMSVSQRQRSNWRKLSDLMPGAYEQLETLHEHGGAVVGVPSGFRSLDRITGGFMPGDLVIIAARPSVGKSALALQIAQHAALSGYPTGLFSLEMSDRQLALRVLAGGAGIDTRSAVPDDAFEAASQIASERSRLPMWIDDTPTATSMDLRLRARRLAAENGSLGLLIVDYLQLAEGRGRESRERDVAEISRNLKALAREMELPVIALCQLNRQAEGRETGEPRLSDLRESGAIEQDADTVVFLWKPGHDDPAPVEEITLTVRKQRNGPQGIVHLVFNRRHTTFTERIQRPEPYYAGTD